MFTVLLILQVILGISVISLVLLQQGKGADMGAAFGSGASGTVFGARGGGSFFSRLTGFLAAAFFINSLLLSTPLVRDPSIPSSVTEAIAPALEDSVLEPEAVPAVPEDLPSLPEVPADAVEPAATAKEAVQDAAPDAGGDLPE